ncbi:MAG: uracil phosphoribosyltransferase [Chloroflexota bacterium]|nr:uracil phosphoribosyltransferase [Dehalococcoidia bacterium]MDW8254319.1 uracil phosphoribosyltransferase [Chloroflexota bacterium]
MLAVSRHPLVRERLGRLRAAETPPREFRALLHDLALMLILEATADLALVPYPLQTPLGAAQGERLAESVAFVPILRAGLGMVPAAQQLFPDAPIWHLGLSRDEETLTPVTYYSRFARFAPCDRAYILDPMVATGGSAVTALRLLRSLGAQRIGLVSVIAAPEGIRAVEAAFPEAAIRVAAVDERLNDHGFIVPGLGDAGDRLFGTS